MRFLIEEDEISNEYDSKGNQLTKAQAEFFKNSKVRDEKGRLLVCYHGTSNKFGTFSYQYAMIHDFGFYGKGFYFTDEYKYAKRYGSKIMRVYLNLSNPYRMASDSMSEKIEYLLNNGHISKEEFLSLSNKLKETSKIIGDTIRELADKDAYIGIRREISSMFSDALVKDGYDGIKTYREFVAFNPNQIKSITNKQPSNNDNINERLEPVAPEIEDFYQVYYIDEDGKAIKTDKYFENEMVSNKEIISIKPEDTFKIVVRAFDAYGHCASDDWEIWRE